MDKKKKSLKTTHIDTISVNRRAWHDYLIEQNFEAGIVLQGWEVKSLRSGKIQFADSYVLFKKNEAWLINCVISSLSTASIHTYIDHTRSRKLLLHGKEINSLSGLKDRQGYSVIPIEIYWKKAKVKLKIALARGKKIHDKRNKQKQADWKKAQGQIMKKSLH